MGSGMSDGMFEAIAIIAILIGVAIGFLIFIGAPWAWQYIKPLIHAITA